jgi:hypothetical protein
VIVVNFPPDARKPHLRDPSSATPFRALCRDRRLRRLDAGEDITGPEWEPTDLLSQDFLCRTCARRAGLR